MSFFEETLKHHLNATRAGLFGQFEHAMNFNTGPDQDASMKLGPGQNIVFTGELEDGTICTLTATNLLTGPSGKGFQAQPENPNNRTIFVGADPATGQAELEFSCPVGGGPAPDETVSYTIQAFGIPGSAGPRYEAIDGTNTVILCKNASLPRGVRAASIQRSAVGDWYCGGDAPGIRNADLFQLDTNGDRVWRGQDDLNKANGGYAAYDVGNDTMGSLNNATTRGKFLVGWDSALGVDQGAGLEPPPLYETLITDRNATTYDVIADDAGFFYVAASRSASFEGNTGVQKDLFKIDSRTGMIVASIDLGLTSGARALALQGKRLTIDPDGDIIMVQSKASVPAAGGPAANVFKLDPNLTTILARADINWQAKIGKDPRYVSPTTDSSGRIYVVSVNGYLVRFDSDLTTEQVSKFLTGGPGLPRPPEERPSRPAGGPLGQDVRDLRHNQSDDLVMFCGVSKIDIYRFDSDGTFKSVFNPAIGVRVDHCHVLPGTSPASNLGAVFTSELSQNPPGRYQAIAAVKYDAGNIVSIFFNSVDVKFKPEAWTAVHSDPAVGDMTIAPQGPGWEYNSPL